MTWYVGFKQNVPLSDMQAMSAEYQTISNYLYTVSKGQVYLYKVKFFDAVAGTANIYNGSGFPTTIDVWVKPWTDEPSGVAGYVYYVWNAGRIGRIVVLPPGASLATQLHEGSHFLFQLSWNVSQGLGDEYGDPGGSGWQSEACIMNAVFSPVRWCASDNHIPRQDQGSTSCWGQILADYPTWTYPATWSGGSPPASTLVEYNDTP